MEQLEEKKIYRFIADTGSFTITGQTSKEVTRDEAEELAKKFVFVPTKPYVIESVCTEEQWEYGYINFCPRCGSKLCEPEEPTYANFTCTSCDAELEIYISVPRNDERE